MKIDDALFNWLQLAVVYKGRPDDNAAKETSIFFRQILTEDFNVEDIRYERDAFKYIVYYVIDGKEESKDFDTMRIEKLAIDIENEPKYNINYND